MYTKPNDLQRTTMGSELAGVVSRDLEDDSQEEQGPTNLPEIPQLRFIYVGFENFHGFSRLVELHIQGNCLTVESLSKLAEAIRLSSEDLRELDLSENLIEVVTADQLVKWKISLDFFENCYMLKRLDFSEDRPAGMETLVEAYLSSELHFDPGQNGIPSELYAVHSEDPDSDDQDGDDDEDSGIGINSDHRTYPPKPRSK
ncbi:hypothetical protein N7508_010884 [Penicillium antarcticum]|uniref:uncharacterized protein n=1 Tax=Penicillium antarcticum TaxID=416450 RepID=UPI0023857816|nr:uncharacterized protein N7508_010884 [Penicillium antarcticum]KAJ5296063.1 hypothetical protein N7508_010884 [Penicillium antarcticum]